ncbi:MAG: hypothetical protein JSS49_05665 [Planctomycetes bacterium]|nr:hypothetical protein [Planctomycetota bacterium]
MAEVNNSLISSQRELRQELDQLRHLRPQFAQRLAEAADNLESPGIAPSTALTDELWSYRERMLSLASALIGDPATDGARVSLDQLEDLLNARDYRRSAETVLEQLTELMHVDLPDFAPLVLCQREASRLCELSIEAIDPGLNSELELLRSERHPLNSLIRLSDSGIHLSDSEWTECHDDVATTYGRQLATALTRGRIRRKSCRNADAAVVVPAPMSTSVAESPSHRSPETTQRETAISVCVGPASHPDAVDRTRAIPASDSIFEPASETIFDAAPTKPGSGRLRMASSPLDATSGRVAGASQTDPKSAARHANDSTSDHVIRLMTDGRLPLAYHLARCLEQQSDSVETIPPSWVLRALILARHLSYSKGEIARQLDDELREYRPEKLPNDGQDRQLAMSFLVRAAALPGALLAGSAPAISILRSFKISPGYSQLYNYCSRIALYGDRLSGSLVEMFRPTGTIAGASELEELSQSARQWLQEASHKAVTYSRSSPLFLHAHWTLTAGTAVRHADATTLWCKWQEALTLAHRLLKPVCEQAEGERNWVRQEIARLTSQIRIEPLDQAQRTSPPASTTGRAIVLPLEEMHSVILEAVAVANRWLRLCHQTSSGSGSPLPLEALELRDEIIKRSEGVLNELAQHRQAATSALVKASIACCQDVVRQIHAMFESRIPLPLVEPDPRHVLNADLLRIPGIVLDDQWSPVTDASIVQQELVASLKQTEMSWRQSYDFHAQAGNHESTGRLLDLEVWSSPAERESMRAFRQSQIADWRIGADSELNELASDLATITETGFLSEHDCQAFRRRIDRFRHDLPRTVDFQDFRLQLSQLRSAMLRPRSTPGPLTALADPDFVDVRRSVPAGHQPATNHSFDIFSGE